MFVVWEEDEEGEDEDEEEFFHLCFFLNFGAATPHEESAIRNGPGPPTVLYGRGLSHGPAFPPAARIVALSSLRPSLMVPVRQSWGRAASAPGSDSAHARKRRASR